MFAFINKFISHLNFAKTLTDIRGTDASLMMKAHNNLIFSDSNPSLKNFGNKDFNVPMRCFDRVN